MDITGRKLFVKALEEEERKDYERRLVAARLPRKHDLDEYDYNFYDRALYQQGSIE